MVAIAAAVTSQRTGHRVGGRASFCEGLLHDDMGLGDLAQDGFFHSSPPSTLLGRPCPGPSIAFPYRRRCHPLLGGDNALRRVRRAARVERAGQVRCRGQQRMEAKVPERDGRHRRSAEISPLSLPAIP